MLTTFLKFELLGLILAYVVFAVGCSNEQDQHSSQITGSAVKGIIIGGIVKAFTTSPSKSLLAQTTTNQFGQFTLNLDRKASGDFFLLELSVDQNTLMRCDLTSGCLNQNTGQLVGFGELLSLPSHFKLMGLAANNARGIASTYISPLSHLIVATALKNNASLTTDSVSVASKWVVNAFNLKQSPLLTQPKDITQLLEQPIITDEQLKQSILSASIYPETLLSDWSQLDTTIDDINFKEILSREAELSEDLSELLAETNSEQLASLNRISQDTQKQLNTLNNSDIVVLTQPSPITSIENASFSLAVQASSDQSLSYQWYKDNSVIPQAQSSSFSKNQCQTSDSGLYHVEISNGETVIKSLSVRVTINKTTETLNIIQQPEGLSITAGDPLRLSVIASGEGALSYQWQKDGSLIPGAISSSYLVSSSHTQDAGSYRVIVSNSIGQIYSNFVNVWVNEPITPISITRQPESISLPQGATSTLSVNASGGGFIRYQWRKNGITLPNATSSSLSLVSVTEADSGIYDVIVSNSQGSVASAKATISILSSIVPVSISVQPTPQTVHEGSPFSLSVNANGDGPFNYQWFLNGSAIAHANSAVYRIESATLKDQGDYYVIVSNPGSSELSRSASVLVQENNQHSIVLSWETPAFREDGTPLGFNEIKGYVIEYGTSVSLMNKKVQVGNNISNEYTLDGLTSGLLSLRIATIDIENRQGLFSEPISIEIP